MKLAIPKNFIDVAKLAHNKCQQFIKDGYGNHLWIRGFG